MKPFANLAAFYPVYVATCISVIVTDANQSLQLCNIILKYSDCEISNTLFSKKRGSSFFFEVLHCIFVFVH